jgi:hypothetical protein
VSPRESSSSDFLRDRIARRLDALPNERLYQVLDYLEFLESKYARRQTASSNVFQRFAEGVEDTMRAGRVSANTIAEAMNLMNKAMGVLSGVAAAGKSVANDVVGVKPSVSASGSAPSGREASTSGTGRAPSGRVEASEPVSGRVPPGRVEASGPARGKREAGRGESSDISGESSDIVE